MHGKTPVVIRKDYADSKTPWETLGKVANGEYVKTELFPGNLHSLARAPPVIWDGYGWEHKYGDSVCFSLYFNGKIHPSNLDFHLKVL